MKIKIGVLTLIMAVMVLCGCGMKQNFKNQEEARNYVLSYMNEKYGQVFIITDEEDYDNYGPIYGDTYTCEVAPKDNPEKAAKVFARQSGSPEDNWAVYYFKENAEEEVKQALSDNKKLQITGISLEAPVTSETWNESDDIEEYMSESGAYVKVVAECEDGLTDYEYAVLIADFLEPIYQLDVNAEISVKVDRTYIFFEKIQVLGDDPTQPFSIEQIEKKVNTMIASSPF